jgi:hypothetical protein
VFAGGDQMYGGGAGGGVEGMGVADVRRRSAGGPTIEEAVSLAVICAYKPDCSESVSRVLTKCFMLSILAPVYWLHSSGWVRPLGIPGILLPYPDLVSGSYSPEAGSSPSLSRANSR